MTHNTALRNTCVLETPSTLINEAFRYAKDNIARGMRYYTHGWGISNYPVATTIVVGRDTGWMGLGIDYVAPWFVPESLLAFRDRQKANGQILEYIDLESGEISDYDLNVADNTPLYIWAVCHHWNQHADERFREKFLHSIRRAADHLLDEIGPRGLIVSVPAGTGMQGITGWRNIIEDYVLAGEVTEINCLSAWGLRMAANFLEEPKYAAAAESITEAVNAHLWTAEGYLLTRYENEDRRQPTADMVFPVLCGIAPPDRAATVLARLGMPDFWTERGLRTIPASDPMCSPSAHFGLIGGVWPNPTLWYAAAAAGSDPNRALAALEAVARPVVEAQDEVYNLRPGEFAEWYHGDTHANAGTHLSPWVAPTFIWAVLEGLLGARWNGGQVEFRPNWPTGWDQITINELPCAAGRVSIELRRKPN